jgi:hypothetical protein
MSMLKKDPKSVSIGVQPASADLMNLTSTARFASILISKTFALSLLLAAALLVMPS